ncbi:hypothetical protein [Actinacidiphila bryophytorum]|uniref:Uncharacterized protein n=1 Tax=Actinacidiphila bryophytorum TaxID=1436133 RepID=A0A9W4H1Y0_9ACTN|nr:hypothetical protein [Actinacidiphila bryophytorum]MBM9435183.1 hypothetical protein [Actinacidiphila bryophytorum]MBN6541564.1 hypothetical protein [Actinacidiphila bryophytorum]CAG7643617.1 conserved hypothetical protein [Actinacidiphila bryophytorum]
MQDPSESMEAAEPEGDGRSDSAGSRTGDSAAPRPGNEPAAASTVLVGVRPGVAVAFGEVPAELVAELKLDPVDVGLLSSDDRTRISAALASIGNTATVGGNLANAFASLEGVYRMGDTARALLSAGGTLAVKDGANLGGVFVGGRIAHQVRWTPVTAVSAADFAVGIGPALAMVALQMMLSQVTGLVRTNIALTSEVLTTMRHSQWAELTALVDTVDGTVSRARELGTVTTTEWEKVAAKDDALRKQRDTYRLKVGEHVQQLGRLDTAGRRQYLETNATAIVFDAYALLSSLKAWAGYQTLHAARARAAGREEADEARLVEIIERETGEEVSSALAETTGLVESLTRELRIIAELPGRSTVPLLGKRKDAKKARFTSAQLLEAIQPLADALRPPTPPLDVPGVLCAPKALDPDRYLRILRWFLEDGETLRAFGLDAPARIGALLDGAKEKVAPAMDKAAARNMVAVTDRRIITARTNAFLGQGEIGQNIPVDRVRYVRAPAARDGSGRSVIDLITAEDNIRWQFDSDVDDVQVAALAAVLAESMNIPDEERAQLRQPRHTSLRAGTTGGSASSMAVEPPGSESPVSDAG